MTAAADSHAGSQAQVGTREGADSQARVDAEPRVDTQARPDREPVPTDLSVYIHVPFCAVRCGYCDFNTYTATELGGGGSQREYPGNAMAEMELTIADDAAHGISYQHISTVFFGGGTPTLLPAQELLRMLNHLRSLIPLAPDAEITTEANPDSVTRESLHELASGGVTRVSLGMQSAVPSVLRTLDRTHDPERIPEVVQWAREAGMQVSLDLIYSTPGETAADVEQSVRAALACTVDHLSAYSLIIEGNTAMARNLRKGLLPPPDPDDMAEKYELIDELLTGAGLEWYEVSNWARSSDHRCRHNLAYWRSADWWGIGPGAHRHRQGMRSWNVKHPSKYAEAITAKRLPVADSEVLTSLEQVTEQIMLGLRVRDGIPVELVPPAQRHAIDTHVERGNLDAAAARRGTARLTTQGRLLADAVIRDLVP